MASDEPKNLVLWGLIAGDTGNNGRTMIQGNNNKILIALKTLNQ